MLKANTGSSVNSDAAAAGREAGEKAGAGLGRVTLAFVYASSDYDLSALVDGVKTALPGVPLIGGTSYQGLITPEGLVAGRYFVGVLAIFDDSLTVGVVGVRNSGHDDDARAVGREAAERAMKKAGRTTPPDYFHLATSATYEEYYLKGLTEVIGRRPVFGAGAVDNLVMGDWQVLTDDGPLGDGMAVAFFYTDKPMAQHFTSAPYRETAEHSAILKMNGTRNLVELEGQSMADRIVERTGLDRELLSAADLQMSMVLDPIGVKDRLGDLVSLCFPMYLRTDGSMDLGSSLAEGVLTLHMRAEIDDLVTSPGQELERLQSMMKSPAGAFHLAMGFGRAMVLRDEERLEEMALGLKKAAGGVPFIMTFSLSECGFVEDGMNTCANLMLCHTGLTK
jgi:Uncharacterized conserved protein